MILDILIFALGFLTAGLLALAMLPPVWRRAMRLSSERLSRIVPLSAEEIAAERDHLRAAHAVDLRRVEQRLERAEAERGRLMAELSRREERIADLGRTGQQLDLELAAERAGAALLRRELADLQAEAGTLQVALHAASGLAEKRWLDLADARLAIETLQSQVDRDRASIAGLETRLLGATTRAEDLARDRVGPRPDQPVAATTDAAPDAMPGLAAAQELAEARRREIEHLHHELAFAHEQAASAERRAADAAREIARLRAERDTRAADVAATPVDETAPPGDDHARLRASIARLADEIMRIGGPATPRP